jgi:hypothetical protein
MISTKDIPTGGGKTPKTLQPGNASIKVNSIYLDSVPWDVNEFNVMMDCEGSDLGDGFEGFFIDKNNEALGKFSGQVGRVRSSQWGYVDKEITGGIQILRDVEITKFLKNLAVATDCVAWLEAEDGKHETINSLVEEMNDKAPFADKYLSVCLGGREYENKAGYMNYDLFFPKFSKQGVPFEAKDDNSGRVYTFNDSDHIARKKVKEVESFTANKGKEGFTV